MTVGFILIVLGIAIGGLIGASEGGGFFFVFPFFFIGTVGDTTILPFFVMLIISGLIFAAFLLWSNRLFAQMQEEKEYVLFIEGECEFCGSPIPRGSQYCPACGKPISYEDDEIN